MAEVKHELKTGEPTLAISMDLGSAKALYTMLKTLQNVADTLGNVQLAYNAHTLALEIKGAIDNLVLSHNKTNQRTEAPQA